MMIYDCYVDFQIVEGPLFGKHQQGSEMNLRIENSNETNFLVNNHLPPNPNHSFKVCPFHLMKILLGASFPTSSQFTMILYFDNFFPLISKTLKFLE